MEILKKGDKISLNYEIDSLIRDPYCLLTIAREEGSVYVARWERLSPAAFLISWQYRLLNNWVESGQFYKVKKIDNE